MLKMLMRPLTNYLNKQFGDIHLKLGHDHQEIRDALIVIKPEPEYPVSLNWNYDMLTRDDRTAMLLGGWHAERVRALPARHLSNLVLSIMSKPIPVFCSNKPIGSD